MTQRFYDTRIDDDWCFSRLRPGDSIVLYNGDFTVFDTNDQAYRARGVFLVLGSERTQTHHNLTTLNVWLYSSDGRVFRKRINEIRPHKVVE